MPKYTVDLSEENEELVFDLLNRLIKQAQNGVTEFSGKGILANILIDLDFQPVED